MEIDASLDSAIFIAAIALGAALVVLGIVFGLRTPPEYGAGEFARGPDNPTVTTIARNDLIARRFFENQALVAKARFWGLDTTGIALNLKGDPTRSRHRRHAAAGQRRQQPVEEPYRAAGIAPPRHATVRGDARGNRGPRLVRLSWPWKFEQWEIGSALARHSLASSREQMGWHVTFPPWWKARTWCGRLGPKTGPSTRDMVGESVCSQKLTSPSGLYRSTLDA